MKILARVGIVEEFLEHRNAPGYDSVDHDDQTARILVLILPNRLLPRVLTRPLGVIDGALRWNGGQFVRILLRHETIPLAASRQAWRT